MTRSQQPAVPSPDQTPGGGRGGSLGGRADSPPPGGASQVEDHPDLRRLAAARPSRAARFISEVTDPALVVAAVTTYVAIRSAGWWAGLGWAGLDVLFCVVLPYGVLFVLLRGGVVADRHVVRREQRLWPSLTALVSVLIGLTLLWRLGAPTLLLALVLSQLAGLVTISLVTLVTKASLHTAVTAGALCVVAILQGGLWWAAALGAAAVVGWARVRGGRHSLSQVVLGLLIGAATTLAVFLPLTR